jgi:hypothetical protein
MAQLAVFGGKHTQAFINNARVGVGGATLSGGVESPISNRFHGHGKRTIVNGLIGLRRRRGANFSSRRHGGTVKSVIKPSGHCISESSEESLSLKIFLGPSDARFA